MPLFLQHQISFGTICPILLCDGANLRMVRSLNNKHADRIIARLDVRESTVGNRRWRMTTLTIQFIVVRRDVGIGRAGRRCMTNIPTDLLRTLIAVVDLRSFTSAAQSLGVTQPAVSAQIKRLQSLLGADLLDKSAPGVTLTSPRRARGQLRAAPALDQRPDSRHRRRRAPAARTAADRRRPDDFTAIRHRARADMFAPTPARTCSFQVYAASIDVAAARPAPTATTIS